MEKLADLFSPHLTESQKTRLTKYRTDLEVEIEKSAGKGKIGGTGLNLAKAFLIPLMAGAAGSHLFAKAQEAKEKQIADELKKQIDNNRSMLISHPAFEHHGEKFHEVFDEVSSLAPHVAANPKLISKIMHKYGPHTQDDLELMQFEALKSLDQKLQQVAMNQHRLMGAKDKGQRKGELVGRMISSTIPADFGKVGSVEFDEATALVNLMHKQIEFIKLAARVKGGKAMKYLKMFGPGAAIAALPAAGFAVHGHLEKKKLASDIEKSFNIVSKNPDLNRAMSAEQISETFNAIANFAPSVARNPAAARAALLSVQGAEGLNPMNIKALVDIERTSKDTKKNGLRDYVLPAATLAGLGISASMNMHKTRESSAKADMEETNANRAIWAK